MINTLRLLYELQNLTGLAGAILAVTLAIMARCSLVAPSDTVVLRHFRKTAFALLSIVMLLACVWESFDPSYHPSWPMVLMILAIDYLMTVSLVSAVKLQRARGMTLSGVPLVPAKT